MGGEGEREGRRGRERKGRGEGREGMEREGTPKGSHTPHV